MQSFCGLYHRQYHILLFWNRYSGKKKNLTTYKFARL